MKISPLVWVLLVAALVATEVAGAATEDDARAAGLELVRELTSLAPPAAVTNTGTLTIKDKSRSIVQIPVRIVIQPDANGWTTTYQTLTTDTNYAATLVIHQAAAVPNRYELTTGTTNGLPVPLAAGGLMIPFGGTDFWVADLGLEFLHWPQQKILRQELRRGQSCHVLESIQTNAVTTGYVRVVAWIDIDTGGIVEADAYDTTGKKVKHFYPRSFRKIEGRYELKRIDITDRLTGSTTQLEFDPPPDAKPGSD